MKRAAPLDAITKWSTRRLVGAAGGSSVLPDADRACCRARGHGCLDDTVVDDCDIALGREGGYAAEALIGHDAVIEEAAVRRMGNHEWALLLALSNGVGLALGPARGIGGDGSPDDK